MHQHRNVPNHSIIRVIIYVCPVIIFFFQLIGKISVYATIASGIFICLKAFLEMLSSKSLDTKRLTPQKRQPQRGRCSLCSMYSPLVRDASTGFPLWLCEHCEHCTTWSEQTDRAHFHARSLHFGRDDTANVLQHPPFSR